MRLISWCKKHWKLLCIDMVCIIFALVLSGSMSHIIGRQYSQQEADRWQGDGAIKYHQVSAYMQRDSAVTLETISQVRSDIQGKLLEASYAQDSVTGRLWIDAYMAQTNDSVSKTSDMGMQSVENVRILGVGGDFFQFHAQDLISGSEFRDDDISQDKVLIDRETAWQLYGGTDIAGKTVEIGSRQFVISGVYAAKEDKTERQARGEQSYVFMDYDVFHEMYPEENIVSYEAVMPNPVKGFALLALKEAFGEPEDTMYAEDVVLSFSDKEYVDNTSRFDALILLKKLAALPKLMMRTTQVSYPYWENAVRALEIRLEVLLLLKIMFLLPVIVTIAIVIVICLKMLRQYLKDNFGRWMDAACRKWDEKARERMQKRALEEEAEDEKVQEMMNSAMTGLGDAVTEIVGEQKNEV